MTNEYTIHTDNTVTRTGRADAVAAYLPDCRRLVLADRVIRLVAAAGNFGHITHADIYAAIPADAAEMSSQEAYGRVQAARAK